MNIFETVSFHLVKPCNMNCKFCYATYNSFKVGRQLPLVEATAILKKLYIAGVRKVTFAGGEPMLYKELRQLIMNAKRIGLTTSIITNGSLIDKDFLDHMDGYLDWIGISIDSLDHETNVKIGRTTRNTEPMNYWYLLNLINSYYGSFKLKVNTVVNRFNQKEVLHGFIETHDVQRWKVFDTLQVNGQNDEEFEAIKSTDFDGFIINNYHDRMVIETNELMTQSYLLIDPLGRFYENWGSSTTKSDTLYNHSVEHCLSQIKLNRAAFLKRGGVYDW